MEREQLRPREELHTAPRLVPIDSPFRKAGVAQDLSKNRTLTIHNAGIARAWSRGPVVVQFGWRIRPVKREILRYA